MGYRNIKARQRNRGDDTNVSGKNEQYHTYKDAKIGKFVNFSINSYDVDGANPTVTAGLQLKTDELYKIDTAGYHVITCTNPSPVNVEMWAWGAGGGSAPTVQETQQALVVVLLEVECTEYMKFQLTKFSPS